MAFERFCRIITLLKNLVSDGVSVCAFSHFYMKLRDRKSVV